MPSQLSDPRLNQLRDLLETEWTPANTAGYDPTAGSGDADFLRLHTGAYDDHPEGPQVVVPTYEEGVVGGGVTGYTAVQGDGSGSNQDRDGTMFVDCWAEHKPNANDDYNGEHAQDLVELFAKEVARIAHANEQGGTTDFRRLTAGIPIVNDDTDADPTVYGRQVEVGYGWLKEPP